MHPILPPLINPRTKTISGPHDRPRDDSAHLDVGRDLPPGRRGQAVLRGRGLAYRARQRRLVQGRHERRRDRRSLHRLLRQQDVLPEDQEAEQQGRRRVQVQREQGISNVTSDGILFITNCEWCLACTLA